MSELKKDFIEDLAKASLLEKKKADLQEQEIEIRMARAATQKVRLEEAKRNEELSKNASFDIMTNEQAERLVKDNNDYLEAAQNAETFIDAFTFKGVVPLFRKNLIFIGAKTGEGKSTAVANIARQIVSELNPVTKRSKRVLVITNEEKAEDFYNRITCLIKGWHYVNHDKFTDAQRKIFNEYIPLLKSLITVVSDDFLGGSGWTTSIEGIERIFANMLRDGIHYDAVLIDYYQNISYSQKDPSLNEYQAQAKLAGILDKYKNLYPAPIVIFGQITPAEEGKENTKPFEYRIKGRKQIIVPATFVMEMVAERGMLRTAWIIHKGRFSEHVGNTIYTGYDNGRFVPYDQPFKEKVLKRIEDRQKMALNRAAGMNFMDTTKKEEPKKE